MYFFRRSKTTIKYKKLTDRICPHCGSDSKTMPKKQKKLIEAWIIIHKIELNELWNIMQEGKDFFKINSIL